MRARLRCPPNGRGTPASVAGMKLIGLTGGIASGKSTIARRLAEHGAVHLDADQFARDAVAPGSPGLARVRGRFGADVITSDGGLDREKLGQIVFADPAALKELNGIVHPEVRSIASRRIDDIGRQEPDAVIVYDVPLLVESGLVLPWDLVVVASAPANVRLDRLVELRGMDRLDAERRIAQQASEAERLAIADVVIDTGGSEAHTLAQADTLWHQIMTAE